MSDGKEEPPAAGGRFIIFRQGQFGDTLVAFPVIDALHSLYPSTPVIYCSNIYTRGKKMIHASDVTQLSPYIKETVSYEFEDSFIKKYLKLRKRLKVTREDVLVYLPYSTVKRYQVIRDWFFFKLLNFRKLKCFKETWEWARAYKSTVKNKSKTGGLPKESERMLSFLRSAGIPAEFSGTCSLNYDGDWAEQKWHEWGLNGREVLAVCPGSKMQSKCWPLERYIEVGRKWHERTGMGLVVVGGPEEAPQAEEVISHWPGYGFSACGVTLAQTAAVLSRARGYCGNDTGSMHLAAIMGIPCVAVFSSREPAELWHPIGENHIVLRKDVECRHCNLQTCDKTPPLCLDWITVEEVLDALRFVMS